MEEELLQIASIAEHYSNHPIALGIKEKGNIEINEEDIENALTDEQKEMILKDEVLNYVKTHDFEVLIVLGAGDLDNFVPQITKILKAK